MTTTREQLDHWSVDHFVTTEELVRQHGVQPITTVDDVRLRSSESLYWLS
jgi:hypothetical protein